MGELVMAHRSGYENFSRNELYIHPVADSNKHYIKVGNVCICIRYCGNIWVMQYLYIPLLALAGAVSLAFRANLGIMVLIESEVL